MGKIGVRERGMGGAMEREGWRESDGERRSEGS